MVIGEPADLVVGAGSGTRRWMVEPVIAAASARIASTGRSARPARYHASAPTSSTRIGTPMSSASVMLPIVSSTSASERCATSVTCPAGEFTVCCVWSPPPP